MADIFDGFPVVDKGIVVGNVTGRGKSEYCNDKASGGNLTIDPEGIHPVDTHSEGSHSADTHSVDTYSADTHSDGNYPSRKSESGSDSGAADLSDDSADVSDETDVYIAPGDCICTDETAVKGDSISGEVISEDDAAVLRDYPDSSEDVDISPVHKRFIDFFLTCGNKTKAAKLAGVHAKNDASMRVQAVNIFKRAEVQAYYKLRKTELDKMCDITFEAFMSELVSIGTLDIRDVCSTESVMSLTDGNAYVMKFKRIEDMPENARKAVKAIEIAKDGTPKMVFYDKLTALKMIGDVKGYLSGGIDEDESESGVALIPAVLPKQ